MSEKLQPTTKVKSLLSHAANEEPTLQLRRKKKMMRHKLHFNLTMQPETRDSEDDIDMLSIQVPVTSL